MAHHYSDLTQSLEKLRLQAPVLRTIRLRMIAGVVTPGLGIMDQLLPSAVLVAAVSILDEALERVIAEEFPQAPAGRTRGLANRIAYLAEHGRLQDEAALVAAKDARNRAAHEHDSVPSWDQVIEVVATVERCLATLPSPPA